MKYYSFKYDSVPNRKQIGVLGLDAQRWFPESVEVVPQYHFQDRNKSENGLVTLTNFPVVDKNVIFMHGLAALQETLKLIDELANSIKTLEINDTYSEELHLLLENELKFQLVEEDRLAENKATLLKEQLSLESIRANEEREAALLKVEEEQKLRSYEAELIQKRMKHEEKLLVESITQRMSLEKSIIEQRESLRRRAQEQIQFRRDEYNRMLEMKKIELEKEKITAELEAKARQEIANEDLTLRRIELQAKLDTDRVIEIVRTISLQVSKIITDLIAKPEEVAYLLGIVLGLVIAYYALREALSLLKNFFQSQLGKPSLVRETSYQMNIIAALASLFYFFDRTTQNFKIVDNTFRDVILSLENRERVIQLAVATRNTKKTAAPYRHVLLHGAPGTGKVCS